MATQAEIDWVKLRLPDLNSNPFRAILTKNGLALTVDQLISDSIDEAGSKESGLSSLLDVMASMQLFDSETIGDYSYSGSKIAAHAAAAGGTAGRWTEVPIVFQSAKAKDENSA